MNRRNFPRRWWIVTVVAVLMVAAANGAIARNRQSTQPVPDTQSSEASELQESRRLREGSVLKDMVGRFRMTGDRVTFYPAGSTASYRALENLALERIARTLEETRGEREWIVSGTVTEFRGGNYLLVSRSILKNASQ